MEINTALLSLTQAKCGLVAIVLTLVRSLSPSSRWEELRLWRQTLKMYESTSRCTRIRNFPKLSLPRTPRRTEATHHQRSGEVAAIRNERETIRTRVVAKLPTKKEEESNTMDIL